MLYDISPIEVDKISSQLLQDRDIEISIVRLDKIHPVLSGNKLFKLYYFLQACQETSQRTILTFGGAYSNHLVATAFACNKLGYKSIGIVRGEEAPHPSHSLTICREYGMELEFIPRHRYRQKDDPYFITTLMEKFGSFTLVPEGGYHPLGAKGASLITPLLDKDYTHIYSAVGTATTIAGILLSSPQQLKIFGVTALKNMKDIGQRIAYLTENKFDGTRLTILDNYHFGGYAKHSSELISFMNDLYRDYAIETDFVYTSKMMYAVFDSVKKGLLPSGSKVACLHTGGLQGNLSLPVNTLDFTNV